MNVFFAAILNGINIRFFFCLGIVIWGLYRSSLGYVETMNASTGWTRGRIRWVSFLVMFKMPYLMGVNLGFCTHLNEDLEKMKPLRKSLGAELETDKISIQEP